MTMIAFAAEKNRAFIMTDGAAYSVDGRGGFAALSVSSTKLVPLHPIDAVITGTGQSGYNGFAALMLEAASLTGTFDEVVARAPSTLREVWRQEVEAIGEDPDPGRETATALIGYSTVEKRFVSYLFARSADFEAQRVEGMFARPMPLGMRPSQWEHERRLAMVRGTGPGAGVPADVLKEIEQSLIAMTDGPPMATPSTASGWRDLAIRARHDFDTAPWPCTFVGGPVYLTTLSRGECRTRLIHTFGDKPYGDLDTAPSEATL